MKNPYGAFKIFHHTEKLESLLEKRITAPVYVRVKPTNKCNHHCFYCSFDPEIGCHTSETFKRSDKIPREKMLEILDDFKDMGVKAVTYSGGGEPLIYPWIEEVMERSLNNRIDLSIITNGQSLDRRRAELLTRAKWVRVSTDASDAETFSDIRRVPEKLFYELKDNIANFARIKNSECELGINFVVHKKNCEQVYDSVIFFRDLGVNHVKITPAWFEDGFFEYHSPIKEGVIEQIHRAQELDGEGFRVYDTCENDFSMSGTKERTYTKCYMMQILPVIAADSCVYFCHDTAYTRRGVFGSLKEHSFKELWFSEEAARIFKMFNPQEECKHYCTNDFKNKSINDALDKVRKGEKNLEDLKPEEEPIHVNFV